MAKSRYSFTPATQRGFTIIELVVAITLLTMIMGVTYGALRGIFRTREVVIDRREARQITSAVLNRMTRELQMAYAQVALMPPKTDPDRRNSTRFNLDGQIDSNDNSSVEFYALEGGQYLPDGGNHSGLVQLKYALQEDPERPQSGPEKTYSLIRTETPYIRPFSKAYEKEMIFPLAHNVVSMKFQYYNNDELEWSSTWGTGNELGLPGIVKIYLELQSSSGRLERFVTAVPLRSTS